MIDKPKKGDLVICKCMFGENAHMVAGYYMRKEKDEHTNEERLVLSPFWLPFTLGKCKTCHYAYGVREMIIVKGVKD